MSLDADGIGLPAEPVGVSAAEPTERRWSLMRVVGGFSLINVVLMLGGLVSGPLLARALGPSGRGDFAAITVPLTIAPLLLGLGLGAYLARAAARGARLGAAVGTTGALVLGIGLIVAALSNPLADLFAGGRETVHHYLVIGFVLMPFSLLAYLLWSVNQGLERWRPIALNSLIPPVLGTAAISPLRPRRTHSRHRSTRVHSYVGSRHTSAVRRRAADGTAQAGTPAGP